ncbi:hypothetical protein C5S31_04070 [ANME-1 cluster archaeon GoMg2]|nr:hypothetical protein [ANME-1 cluster archaeon GoMg2]
MHVAKKERYMGEKCAQMGILYARHVIIDMEVQNVHYVERP